MPHLSENPVLPVVSDLYYKLPAGWNYRKGLCRDCVGGARQEEALCAALEAEGASLLHGTSGAFTEKPGCPLCMIFYQAKTFVLNVSGLYT